MECLQTIAAVLIGAGLTYLSSWLLDLRRERAARERERRQEALDLRVAARLLRHELLDAEFVMMAAADSGAWPSGQIRTEEWRAVGPTVSRALTFHHWATVNQAYSAVVEFNQEIAEGGRKFADYRWRVEEALEHIEAAEDLLIHAANDYEEVAAFRDRWAAESEARLAAKADEEGNAMP